MSNICYGCITEKKVLKNNYCTSCIKTLFDNKVPNKLNFSLKEFIDLEIELSNKFSISGVQDKITLAFEKNDLVPVSTKGKYILKPKPTSSSIKNLDDIVANEHLSMIISKNIFKINTANCGIIEFSDNSISYITKRFDYDEDEIKYDQEDFAALLNITSYTHGSDYKYDAANYLDCAMMIKRNVATSIIAIEDFFKRILLNYLIANGDAHLKNFSLYSKANKTEYSLTPNYDLLNTRYHINEVYGDMALELMDNYTKDFEAYGYYTKNDFIKFAELLDIPSSRVKKIFKLIETSYENVEKLIDNSFLSNRGKEFYKQTYIDRMKRLGFK